MSRATQEYLNDISRLTAERDALAGRLAEIERQAWRQIEEWHARAEVDEGYKGHHAQSETLRACAEELRAIIDSPVADGEDA